MNTWKANLQTVLLEGQSFQSERIDIYMIEGPLGIIS